MIFNFNLSAGHSSFIPMWNMEVCLKSEQESPVLLCLHSVWYLLHAPGWPLSLLDVVCSMNHSGWVCPFLTISNVAPISQASCVPLDATDSPSTTKPRVRYRWDWETLLQWQISAAGHSCTECTNQFTARLNQREQKACELCQQSVPWKHNTSRSNERHNFKGIAYQCKYVNPHPS